MSSDKVISVFSGKRVLVAEDNDISMEIITQMLLSMGIMVDQAADGSQAVEKVRQAEAGYYDMAMLDVHMPEVSGLEAAREITQITEEKGQKIPMVAITASSSEEMRDKIKTCGMAGLIEKPLEKETIKKVLEQYLVDGVK